ncbi:MAG: hypothetical protein HY000_31865 [Planctomycetes bacterium]|nr:hypothetical protein [Planctomycetota bacterium]
MCVDTQPAWYYKDRDALAEALGGQRLQKFIGLAECQLSLGVTRLKDRKEDQRHDQN